MSYYDLNMNLSKEDIDLKTETNRFAREVMRPVSIELDKMTAKEAIASESPFWEFMRKAYELDYHKLQFPEEFGGSGLTPLQISIVMEELAWGSLGLTQALNTSLDAVVAMGGTEAHIREFTVPYCQCTDGTYIGCWAITEPDHGSDALMPFYPNFSGHDVPAQCRARHDGNEWVIEGQKSAWVSAGTIARSVLLMCRIDSSGESAGNGIFIFSLDRSGVSRGEPLNKIGTRELNHGEIFFNKVRVPKESLIIGPEGYEAALEAHLCLILPMAGIWSTGLARAGFEEALNYARKRVQGGKRLVEHKSVQQKLFDMFRKVETSRQLCRAALVHNWSNPPKTRSMEHGIAAKTYATQVSLDVTSDAIQIFGGIGITKEYIVEKLFRDARTTMICDGSNDVLSMDGGYRISRTYK